MVDHSRINTKSDLVFRELHSYNFYKAVPSEINDQKLGTRINIFGNRYHDQNSQRKCCSCNEKYTGKIYSEV